MAILRQPVAKGANKGIGRTGRGTVGIICIHGKMDTDFQFALATRGLVGKLQKPSYTYLGGVI